MLYCSRLESQMSVKGTRSFLHVCTAAGAYMHTTTNIAHPDCLCIFQGHFSSSSTSLPSTAAAAVTLLQLQIGWQMSLAAFRLAY